MHFLKNLGRNIKATGLYFLIGVALSAVFQRYVPAEAMTALLAAMRRSVFGWLPPSVYPCTPAAAGRFPYHVSVIYLRNPTRSHGKNLLYLVNKSRTI